MQLKSWEHSSLLNYSPSWRKKIKIPNFYFPGTKFGYGYECYLQDGKVINNSLLLRRVATYINLLINSTYKIMCIITHYLTHTHTYKKEINHWCTGLLITAPL